jgi:hypothetical protein
MAVWLNRFRSAKTLVDSTRPPYSASARDHLSQLRYHSPGASVRTMFSITICRYATWLHTRLEKTIPTIQPRWVIQP